MKHSQSEINRQVISMMSKHKGDAEDVSAKFALRFLNVEMKNYEIIG